MDARIGFVTQLGMDRIETAAFAADRGFDFVELMMDGAGERRRLAADGDAFADALAERDLDLLVHLPFGGIDLGSPFEHVREGSIGEIEAAVETAAALGAEKAVLHPDTNAWSPAWDDDDLRANAVDSVRRIDAHAGARDVEICAENLPRSLFRTHDVGALLDGTDASLTLDTGHARMDGRDSAGIAAFAEEHADRISHVHLNDTRGPQDEHLPFGAGDVDFERIFAALPDDWSGTLSLEVFTFAYDYVGASKERLDALLEG
ncbi:sugar phosphate isomerase/epimerase family protein [Halegenticoccus tardaugens]|uniref:sugar phosphate isomerase/epimerase family protein n=1 Tax=Halegenticoccus tardaugens TaxID=2071624 RepID=UPI00100C235D|nr:sugar phosphate isomerase/epimerase family protein [Halegenticoccus tardaugens]